MSEHIKTGEEILKTLQHGIELQKRLNQKWVSLDWLKEQVKMKYNETYNLPGDIQDIRDLGRMDSLRWVLSLLEEE